MRKLGLLALFALILWSSMLYGELDVLISEQIEINPPYSFDQYFYNGDDEVHFYRTEIENGSLNLYHFSLQEVDFGDYQYTVETQIASVDTLGTGIEYIERRKVYDFDALHLLYYNNDHDIVKVSGLTNWTQLLGTIDLSDFASETYQVTSACDSLVVLHQYQPDSLYIYGHSTFYKCNIETGDFEILNEGDGWAGMSGRFGSYVGIYARSEGQTEGLFSLYDNQLNFISHLTPSSELEDPYTILSALECSDYFEQIPFENGFITYEGGGQIPENPNLGYTYYEIENNVAYATEIREFLPDTWDILEDGSIYGFAGGWPGGGPTFFYYLTYDGDEWTEVVSEISNNGTRPIVIDLFYITSYVSEGFIYFTVFDHGETGWQQEMEITAPVGYHAENFFDQLFYIDPINNTICYFIYDFTYPNADYVNPAHMPITTSNYPNPFNPETTIEYSVPATGNVEVTVYNILGQKINTLVNTEQPKGTYNVVWNGTDNNNKSLSSGVYFYKVEQNGKSTTNKIVLMK